MVNAKVTTRKGATIKILGFTIKGYCKNTSILQETHICKINLKSKIPHKNPLHPEEFLFSEGFAFTTLNWKQKSLHMLAPKILVALDTLTEYDCQMEISLKHGSQTYKIFVGKSDLRKLYTYFQSKISEKK